MIVVQRVLTEWTKRSRGAPGAVRRNAVAEAFPLPSARGAGDLWVHQVTAREQDDFAVRETAGAGAAGVWVEVMGTEAVVTGLAGAWCQCCTVFPPRPERVVLRLAPGQWGRWRVNFRFWDGFEGSEWRYQKWVVNVGHLRRPPAAELFRATGPDVVADDLVQLARPTRWAERAIQPSPPCNGVS